MDPHEVLNLPRYGYSADQLRYNYKIIALQLHPDKRPGTMSQEQATEAFQVLTDAYRKLTAELEGNKADRTFDELKSGYAQHHERQRPAEPEPEREPPPPLRPPPPLQPRQPPRQQQQQQQQMPRESQAHSQQAQQAQSPDPDPGGKRFNLSRFNEVYDENRLADPVRDHGYESWMRDNDPESDSQKKKKRNELQRYAEPAPFILGHRGLVQFSELGSTGVDDYGRGDATRRSVQYTDYRVAHTTSKLLEDDERYMREAEARAGKELRSVDALMAHREAISYEMTADEQRAEDRRAADAERAERRRREALRTQDSMIEQTHDRMRRLMLR